MKPSSWDKPLGLASPRESAASQSDQTNNPSKNEVRNEVGLDVSTPHPHLPEGRGEVFSLTSLFIGLSEVNVRAETFFHRLAIENVGVSRKLDALRQPSVQIADKQL